MGMDVKLFRKNLIFNIMIFTSLLYAIIIYLVRIFNREKTMISKVKNKQNIDELLFEIENNLVSDAKTTTHFFNDDMPHNIKSKLDIVNNEILELLGPEYKSISKINEIYFTAKKTG